MPENNEILSNEFINSAFTNNDLKRIYTILLKLIKHIDNDSIPPDLFNQINSIFKLLNSQKSTLILKDQEKYIEEKLKDVYNKIDLIRDENHSEFFKFKILELFKRDLIKFFRFFYYELDHDNLAQFLNHIIRNAPLYPEILFKKCLELLYNSSIKSSHVELLLDGLFEEYPSIVLNLIFRNIRKKIQTKTNNQNISEIDIFLRVLVNYSEIYSALYKPFFKKVKQLIFSKHLNIENRILAIQIIYNIIKEQPNTYFDYIFHIFHAIDKIIRLNQLQKYRHLLNNSLKLLYSSQSETFLSVFEKNQKNLNQYLINLMKKKYALLNDFILDMFLDFLKYYKIVHAKGKISRELLDFYLNFLKFLEENNLENEYFLFSIITHLNLTHLNLDEISEELTENKKKLKNYYLEVIKEIEKSIKIIFDSS